MKNDAAVVTSTNRHRFFAVVVFVARLKVNKTSLLFSVLTTARVALCSDYCFYRLLNYDGLYLLDQWRSYDFVLRKRVMDILLRKLLHIPYTQYDENYRSFNDIIILKNISFEFFVLRVCLCLKLPNDNRVLFVLEFRNNLIALE